MMTSSCCRRLSKVRIRDVGNSCIVEDVTRHPAPTEETATNIMFVGKTNRSVAKTSMNMKSSRSHSIFTLNMTSQAPGSDVITRCKLNLVDLAGSERVGKSHAKGMQLTEAKHINLSLHYLETVIVSLQQSGRKRHVPYRNSALTKLLRDSLGGNCVTAMIATVSTKETNKYESISTCRFAQRVARVSNKAQVNQMLDDKTLIKQLRKRIAQLQAELKLAYQMGSGGTPSVTPDIPLGGATSPGGGVGGMHPDRVLCRKVVHKFLKGTVVDPLQACEGNLAGVRVCFDLMKAMVDKKMHTGPHAHPSLCSRTLMGG